MQLGMGPKALFRWTYSREDHCVQLLLDAMEKGQRVENGWKPQVYIDIIASFKTNGFGVVTGRSLISYSINDDDSTVHNDEPNSTAQRRLAQGSR